MISLWIEETIKRRKDLLSNCPEQKLILKKIIFRIVKTSRMLKFLLYRMCSAKTFYSFRIRKLFPVSKKKTHTPNFVFFVNIVKVRCACNIEKNMKLRLYCMFLRGIKIDVDLLTYLNSGQKPLIIYKNNITISCININNICITL